MLRSISRLRSDICPQETIESGRTVISRLAAFKRVEDMINIGAYAHGSNPDIDKAISSLPLINAFLRQDVGDKHSLEDSFAQLSLLAHA